LTTLSVVPNIDWIWTLGLAITGFLVFLVGGFEKVTFVTGSFLILTSVLSILGQTNRISIDVEIPILVLVAGIQLLVARSPAIPIPRWILDPPDHR
jgi:hypothetical protein